MEREAVLWYDSAARVWEEALPVGNGRLGAMVFGGVHSERIQLNEDSLWSGGFRDRNNKDAKRNLPEIRELLKQGKITEAQELARYGLTGTPEFQRCYQTLGDLYITFQGLPKKIENYRRSLSLEDAVSYTQFEALGHTYEREVFASAPANIIVVHMTSTCPEGMSFDARLIRNRFCDNSGALDENTVFLDGNNGGADGIGFCCCMTGKANGGKIEAIGEYIVARGVREALLLITAATTFREENPMEYCLDLLKQAEKASYTELCNEHIDDYRQYEEKMSFHLDYAGYRVNLPTNKRLQLFKEDHADLGLIELYFRYGRYLLISSSRPGSLPANLQGIWCKDFLPPWDSKYTININAQMNYWHSESCNLSECHLPLFDLIKRMHPNGVETASVMYGARGFVAHHNTDIWGDTAPQDTWIPASYWVLGAAWLCLHIWEHYEYTLDIEFLNEQFYLLYDACLFFVDFLIENDKGELIVSPTVSPENTYRLPDGTEGQICMGCTMDSQILAELFTACIKACKVLDRDMEFADQLAGMLKRLPLVKISKNGCIQEWLEDYDEVEPGHRHISHLFGLFPGNSITQEETPELTAAARKTLENRLSHGGGHTGWSRAWIINFWARLGDGEKAGKDIDLLLADSTLPNLFDNHPPFQIDGNFGGTAGIANLIMQSSPDRIKLLPALPSKWTCGSIKGLKAKGGLTVDIEWKNNAIANVIIKADHDYTGTVYYGNIKRRINLSAGEITVLDDQLMAII